MLQCLSVLLSLGSRPWGGGDGSLALQGGEHGGFCEHDHCAIVARSLRRRTSRAFNSLFHTCQRLCLSTWPLPNFSATLEIWWRCPSNSPACNCTWAKGRGEEATVRHTMVGQLCSALARYSLRRCTSASTDSFPNPCWSQLQVNWGGEKGRRGLRSGEGSVNASLTIVNTSLTCSHTMHVWGEYCTYGGV